METLEGLTTRVEELERACGKFVNFFHRLNTRVEELELQLHEAENRFQRVDHQAGIDTYYTYY